MSRIEKTVFISYRRTNVPWALAIYQNLTSHGYDVFFDYTSLASGDFERVILENITARAHFLVLLTPSALQRCNEPEDWLRREIETAVQNQRNIVPLMLEGFDFITPAQAQHLTGKLAALRNYNALRIPADFFEEAMARLRDRYLNVALEIVLDPLSGGAQRVVQAQQAAASAAARVPAKELSAQEWFEKGYNATDPEDQIRCYSEAIRLKPDDAVAYYNRGLARKAQGDLDGAIGDYSEAIRLKPYDADAYNNRGIARKSQGDLDGAIRDYSEAIRLKPDDAAAYNNRGLARKAQGDLDGAIGDYSEAIRLKPDYADAYNIRGVARKAQGKLDDAMRDYSEAIRLKPDYAVAYYNRGIARKAQGDRDGAIRDYSEAIRLKPDDAAAYNNRGLERKAQGDLDGAIGDYSEAIRLKPDYAVAYNNRGVARKAQGKLDDAMRDYSDAIRLKPDYAAAYNNRGVARKAQADREGAIRDLQKYLDLGGGMRDGDQAEVETMIRNLRTKR